MSQDLGTTHTARLGDLMRRRQVELDLTWEAIADRAGLSRTTLTGIRNGKIESTQPRTIRSVERALQWEDGSIDAILAGGDPTPADTASLNPPTLPGNAHGVADDHFRSRATPEEINITLQRAAERDRELGRNGELYWKTWDVLDEVNHPRRQTPPAATLDDRSA